MISKIVWWRIIQDYYTAISSFRYILFIIGVLVVFIFFKYKSKLINRILNLYLAFCFAWISLFFVHWGREITGNIYGSILFSLIFLIVAIFFLSYMIKDDESVYIICTDLKIGIWCLLSLYPLVGFFTRLNFDNLSLMGTMPCPTVAFALFLLTFRKKRNHPMLLAIFLLWSLPGTLFLQVGKYGVYEDILLFISGIYYLAFRKKFRYKYGHQASKID